MTLKRDYGPYGCFYEMGVLLVGVIRALLLGGLCQAPHCCKLPYTILG